MKTFEKVIRFLNDIKYPFMACFAIYAYARTLDVAYMVAAWVAILGMDVTMNNKENA